MTHVQEGLNENSSVGKNISRSLSNIWMPFGPSRQRYQFLSSERNQDEQFIIHFRKEET
jgi:hypothetical protein